MDTNLEDKMYHQIEKNLSNSINENLFTSGRLYEKDKLPVLQSSVLETTVTQVEDKNKTIEYTGETYDYVGQTPGLSRAEYIRQAREACLRQLNNQSMRDMDTYNYLLEDPNSDSLNKKRPKSPKMIEDKEKILRLPWNGNSHVEEETPHEIASFKSLIIRMICAIVILLVIFAIDKFNFKVGAFSKELVREYVTGNDTLQHIEEIVVSWLK